MTKKQSYSTSETFTQIQWIWKNPDAWLLQVMIDHNYISYFDQKEETKSKLKIVKRTGSGSATKIAFSDDSLLSLHDSAWGTSLMIPFWSIVLFHIADHQGPEWHWKMTLQNAWHYTTSLPMFDRKDLWIQGITQDSQKKYVCFQVCFLRKCVASTRKSLRNQAAKIHPKHLQGALEGRACRQPKRWMDGRGHLQKKQPRLHAKIIMR